jgi:diadenosine tetraphosphate (Ap4A) HIT family hydrolase
MEGQGTWAGGADPAGPGHHRRPGHHRPASRQPRLGRADLLAAARAGDHPAVIAKLRSGYVMMGETQFLPGYCLLIAEAEADHLADLPRPARERFLADLSLLGEALMAACAAWDPAFSRLNYEILGNSWRHLHAHVFPRYTWEPAELREGPVWWHPQSCWTDPDEALGPEHDRLVEAITRELSRVLAEAY